MNKTYIAFTWAFILVLTSGTNAQPKILVKKSFGSTGGNPDIILYNANVLTMDEQTPNAQAIAIAGNVITAVGTDSDILALQAGNTQLIDLQSRTVVPGLIEGHSHALKGGFRNDGIDGLKRAAQNMAADGYTTAHELGYRTNDLPGFIESVVELAQRGELPVRMNLYMTFNGACGEEIPNNWNSYPYTARVDTMVRVVGVKAFGDGGSCNSGCLTTKWQSGRAAGTFGDCYLSEAEWDSALTMILAAGYPIAMHAIGDSAVGVGLNAFEKAFAGNGNTLRCRMEHLGVLREDLVDKMAALGIGASIQYTWARAQIAAISEARYSPKNLDWLYAWQRIANRGIPILGGNDGPNFSLKTHAMETISLVATRKQYRDEILPDWMEGDQLTVEQGLRAMTVNNAWGCFEENVKGTITTGKLADLTVLSDDPLLVDPFDVRDIEVEMTVMDGVIRHNQIGISRTAIHDAGTFSIAIGDQGFWGEERLPFGLQYKGEDLLYRGSLLISYDETTVATATIPQQDYITSPDGQIQFVEPGETNSEEATVFYEDDVAWHPGRIQVKQETFMSTGEPFLLVKYTFKNIGSETAPDLYFGQLMKFSIGDFRNNLGAWEANNGLGFAYMYENDNTATPYVGMAMFDTTGQSVNSSLTLNGGSNIRGGHLEPQFALAMRSDSIETATPTPGNYAVLPASGPFALAPSDSISPFWLAIVAGDNVEDLRGTVQQAYQRSTVITHVDHGPSNTLERFVLFQNYPNPFNPSTTIRFVLPKAEHVKAELFNVGGQKVATLLEKAMPAGGHKIDFEARHLASGVYVFRIEAGVYRSAKKMLYLK